jgi:hypothetical protein
MYPIHIALREGILPDRPVWQVLHEDRDAILDATYDLWGMNRRPDRFAGPTCVSIERKDFEVLGADLYWVCEKTDGIRYIMTCMVYHGLNIIAIINRNHEVFLLGIDLPTPFFSGTVLDGEIAINKKTKRAHYLAFDAMAIAGERVADKTFGTRMSALLGLVSLAVQPTTNAVVVQPKKFFPMAAMQEFVAFKKLIGEYFDDDGVVFTPDAMPVETFRHRKMFKWKRADGHTVDFVVAENFSINVFDAATKKIKKVGTLRTQTTERGETIREGDIVECGIQGANWHPLMVRTDKTHSNDVETFRRTIGNVKENIQFEEFHGIDLLYMRT